MTRSHRTSHLWIWIVLAIALPALLIVSVLARRDTTPANRHVSWETYK